MGDLWLTILNAVLALAGPSVIAYFTFRGKKHETNSNADTTTNAQRDTALGKAADIALEAVEPFRQIVQEQTAMMATMRQEAEKASADMKILLSRIQRDNEGIIYNLQVIVQSLLLLVNRLDDADAKVDPAEKAAILAKAEAAIKDMKEPGQ